MDTNAQRGFSEAEIGVKIIIPALVKAGWDEATQIRQEVILTPGSDNVRENLLPRNKKGRQLVDYVLQTQEGVPVAVVEVRGSQDARTGMQQALSYAETLDVPSVFSANGAGFIFHNKSPLPDEDIETELSMDEFPSPEELWQRYKNYQSIKGKQDVTTIPPYYDDGSGKKPRYYQVEAINRVVEAVSKGQRRLLLVMAVGTGKTYITFQAIWCLRQAKRIKQVLFLVDRNILADQLLANDFKPFRSAMIKIENRKIDPAYDIHIGLYQALTGPDERHKAYKSVPRDFFDLIIIDECHRGISREDSSWREILEYFDKSTQLGVTATPKETGYVSSSEYFGNPVYSYSLKQGIQDGFLAPYKVIRVNLDVEDRLSSKWIKEDLDLGNLVSDQRTQLVASSVMKQLKATDPYSKTIVFCENINHAERMREAIANAAGALAVESSNYVVSITSNSSKESRYELRNFASAGSRYPVIVTTSELLGAGVYVPTCKLIVLDKTINSMVSFKQIVGLGTRMMPSHGKHSFTIMDFRNATQLFADAAFDGEPTVVYESNTDDDSMSPDLESIEDEDNENISSDNTGQPCLFPPSWAETWGDDEYGLYADLIHEKVTQRFRWIAAGDFLMGSPENEAGRGGDEQQHKVTLSQGYWLADTTTTQALWLAVIGKNPSDFDNDSNNPVEQVSWNDCQVFIKKLNLLFSNELDGLVFRLPTEAEWEHACRAGTNTPFSFGENISPAQVNFDDSDPYNNSQESEKRSKTVAVKSLPANQWGLYEMHGNVLEWCADTFQKLGDQPIINPYISSDSISFHVRRGGLWAYGGALVRSACRHKTHPGRGGDPGNGFRFSIGHELRKTKSKLRAKQTRTE